MAELWTAAKQPGLGWTLYWATGTVVDRLVHIGQADSVREAWYEADCFLCDWHTSGSEPNVEDAAHEHVSDSHQEDVKAERVFLAAARAHCEATHNYDATTYKYPDDRERHIQAEAATLARHEPFRAAITAAVSALAATGRLVPAGAEVHAEYKYVLTYHDGTQKERVVGSLAVARAVAASPANWNPPGQPGEVFQRVVTTAVDPWLPVPETEEKA